jgi:oxaloacetate decarboxylase alpha subunit
MAPLPELRARLGAQLSDEEFLLRATMPATQVDAMRAVAPAARHYDPESKPVMELLRRVLKLRNVAELRVTKADFRLELRGGAGGRVPAP